MIKDIVERFMQAKPELEKRLRMEFCREVDGDEEEP